MVFSINNDKVQIKVGDNPCKKENDVDENDNDSDVENYDSNDDDSDSSDDSDNSDNSDDDPLLLLVVKAISCELISYIH